ncbi:MAG: OB-fold nucleic acid binding domain-containing protein [Planctomycetes bacterium]|nr:OB-fold nucleic acid binding domain-containing protein [Planctomycetota bacterium]
MHHRQAVLAIAALAPFAAAQSYASIDDAPVNPALSPATSTFLSLPGSFTDLVRSGGGQFVDFGDGTARLTCRVFSQSNLYVAFLVDIQLSGKVRPIDPGYPPINTPDERLFGAAYDPVGPIDPSTFTYFTAATGTLTGVRNMAGTVLTLAATEPVQIGSGANNTNDHYGLFGEFAATVTQGALSVTGPATLALDFETMSSEPTTHPQPYDGLSSLPAGRAMVIPGVGDDYVFVPAADFHEFDDGTATVLGSLKRLADPDDTWDLAVSWSGRVDPSQANYPPVGSPVLQLLPLAYVQNGGLIDPDHWHYYTAATATLTGTGVNAGGELSLTPTVATQVGGGANNTNSYFGFYGAFSASVVTQPTQRTLAPVGDVELFTLTAVFPVLPFPSLTAPATTPTLPTLTADGVVLEGDNLYWTELAAFDFDLMGKGDATAWFNGYFRVLDNQHLEVHPRAVQSPGLHNVLVYNPAIQSNSVQVDLVQPTVPTLVAEPSIGEFGVVHARVHHGTVTGPAFTMMTLSTTQLPSVYPGLASLTIGNNFTDLLIDYTLYSHDADGIAAANFGPITAQLLGLTFYFQAVILDVGAQTVPLPATNDWTVLFQ